MPVAIPIVVAMAVSMVASVALSFVTQAIAGSGKKKQAPPPDARDSSGMSQISRNPVEPRRIVYGAAKVSGPLVFAATSPHPDTGKSNGVLHLVIPVASHTIAAFHEVYFNDATLDLYNRGDGVWVPKAGSSYSYGPDIADGQVHVEFYDGTQTTASQRLIDAGVNWDAQHVLRGIAYIYVQLIWKDDFENSNFPGGIPNISVLIEGNNNVWDPRSSTSGYTSNPALCVRDYMTKDYGLACGSDEIDDVACIAAANVCDESVALADGTFQRRYSCDGAVTLDKKPIENIESMLSSCDGTIVYSQGAYSIFAAAYDTPTVTLDEDDLRGPIKVHARPSRRELFNAVRGNFIDRTLLWASSAFPPVTNGQYEAEDNNEQIFKDLDLPFTIDRVAAQRIAKVHLDRARQGLTVEFPAKLTALRTRAWDMIYVDSTRLGWSSKVFRIKEWKFSDDGGIDLMLQEEAAASYDWNFGNATVGDPAPDTNLPDPFRVPAPGIALSDDVILSASGIPVTRLIATLTESTEATVVGYQVQYQLSTEPSGTWHDLGTAGGNSVALVGAIDLATYNVRARAITIIGMRSPWATATRTVIGQFGAPEDVHGFAVNFIGETGIASWSPVSNVDLAFYRIRWSPLTTGATWNNAVDLVGRVGKPATSVQIPALTGTFLIKAVNLKGVESVNVTVSISTIAAVINRNAVTTVQEDPEFAGDKDGTVVLGGLLRLAATDLVSTWPLVSAVPLISYGLTGLVSQGTYYFANTVDLGAVFTSRVTASIKSTGALLTNLVSLWPLVSARQSITGASAAEQSVTLQVRTTDDDPAGSPTWSDWRDFVVGDYTCRAYGLSAILSTTRIDVTPLVEELRGIVDMPDRHVTARNVVSNAAGDAIVFSPPFKGLKATGITGKDLHTGDYFTITSETVGGMTVRWFNSSNTGVSRTYDYDVLGYGQ